MPDDDATETNDAAPDTKDATTPDDKSSRFRRSVAVPAWLAGVAAALVLLGAGFAIGWFSAPGDEDTRSAVEIQNSRELPNPRDQLPQIPRANPGANRGILGVTVQDANAGTEGALVTSVLGGGPAADAGLQPGDVVTAVDDAAVYQPTDLIRAIRSHGNGDSVTIHFRRGNDTRQARVKLARPSGLPSNDQNGPAAPGGPAGPSG